MWKDLCQFLIQQTFDSSAEPSCNYPILLSLTSSRLSIEPNFEHILMWQPGTHTKTHIQASMRPAHTSALQAIRITDHPRPGRLA
jgi:hypothetical protein